MCIPETEKKLDAPKNLANLGKSLSKIIFR